MTVKYHHDLIQCSEEWYAARCGILTASEMDNIITPKTLKYSAAAEKHLYELLAQRITKYVEPHYISDDMMRGKDDELDAKRYYEEHYSPVKECGFITNDEFGFTLGYSPDGLVGDDGLIEVKSRRQKLHLQTIINRTMPDEFVIQVQTGLLISKREWCDFISFCGGMKMLALRIWPDHVVQNAIVEAAKTFHLSMSALLNTYVVIEADPKMRLIPTERRPPEKDMHL